MADVTTTAPTRDPNVIYESTPDGDIRTIIVEDPNNNKNNDDKDGGDGDLFQHNLRNSWDDEYQDFADRIGGGGVGKPSSLDLPQRRHRHKHNLSVQFFDISISDNNEGASENANNGNEMQEKQPPPTPPLTAAATAAIITTTKNAAAAETTASTTTTTTLFDKNNLDPPVTADTTPSPLQHPQHTRTKSGIEVEAAAAYYFESNESSPEKERAKNDDIANFQKNVHSSWESGDEEESFEEDESSGGEEENDGEQQQSQRSNRRRDSPSKESRRQHNLSVQFTDSLVVGDGKEETLPRGNLTAVAAKEFQPPFLAPGTASTSMLSDSRFFSVPSQQQQQPMPPPPPPLLHASPDIVIPLPIVVRPSVNRKHHRVYSGRSNPAMAHRRVNTRGDSTPTKEDNWSPTAASMPPPHPNLPPPKPHHSFHPPHPASGHPYPSYYHQGTPPLPSYGTLPSPPPYDPHYAASQPVDPRYYAAPSQHYNNSSPVSDAGVNYDARTSPIVYPSPPLPPPPDGGGQYPSSVHSSPGGYYAVHPPPPHASNPYARLPNHLSQPTLDQEEECQPKKLGFSDRNKENKNDARYVASAHHRQQSSLGSFLANAGFEDLFDDGGYDSAPDEQQSKRHNKTLSSASFLRSLSSDNFLRDHLPLVDEEQSNVDSAPYTSPRSYAPQQVNSSSISTGGTYHQPFHGFYYAPPQTASMWQQHPNSYPQHSPIQSQLSTQQRPSFGGGVVQTQFQPPSPPPQQCIPASTPSSGEGSDCNQKRQRRKCSIPDCPNRVVQGGLCIGHGAKRKMCSYPGCEKNVKAKGLCSTHGPARKRCNAEGCGKVAVQGGRCIAHGAKKKVCAFPECFKQAIMGGMCKKHHDETHGLVRTRGPRKSGKGKNDHSGHERGLSLFTDSAIVDTIISNSRVAEQQYGSDDAL